MERTRPDNSLFVFSVAITAVAILSFALAAIENPLRQERYSPMVVLHAALMTAWLLLLVVQVTLVRTRRTAIHRALGRFSGLLVVAIVLNSIPVALDFHDDFGRDLALYGDFSLLIAFVSLYALAVFNALKGRFENHKRYILVASIILVLPASSRAVDVFDGSRALAAILSFSALIFVPLAYDWISTKRVQWVTVRAVSFSLVVLLLALAMVPRVN